MFCKYCGVSNPNDASFCSGCGKVIAGSPPDSPMQQQAPPITNINVPPNTTPPCPKRRGLGRFWIVVSILAVIVIAAILLSGPKPEDSFDQARLAYLQHDQKNFDKYVDVQSILGDWTDQTANAWLQENHAGVAGRLVMQGVVQALKSAYLPAMSQSVDQFVVSGTLTEQPQSNESDQTGAFLAGFVSSGLRELVSSQLLYEGVSAKSISDTNALLDVNVRTPLGNQPIVVRIKMQKDGDHWRVVAVQDLVGLLQQLGQSSNK